MQCRKNYFKTFLQQEAGAFGNNKEKKLQSSLIIFCIMLQEKQEMQPLKVFWEKDVFLKIAALTVAR